MPGRHFSFVHWIQILSNTVHSDFSSSITFFYFEGIINQCELALMPRAFEDVYIELPVYEITVSSRNLFLWLTNTNIFTKEQSDWSYVRRWSALCPVADQSRQLIFTLPWKPPMLHNLFITVFAEHNISRSKRFCSCTLINLNPTSTLRRLTIYSTIFIRCTEFKIIIYGTIPYNSVGLIIT